MRLLYIGDIMGEVGVDVVAKVLPELKRHENIDVVIAQAENVTGGKGMSVADCQQLRDLGVDGFSGGNHTTANSGLFGLLKDENVPVTGPANMPSCPGPGYKYISTPKGKVLMVSLLGQIVGRDADKPVDNPLHTIDEILARENVDNRGVVVVNFHGDYSSEKVVIGYYLDGRASAVIGDHWHVPTADAQVLSGGTAHQTDVGMVGALDSSLGVTYRSVLTRWLEQGQTRNVLETQGRRQFNALMVDIIDAGESAGRATAVTVVRRVL